MASVMNWDFHLTQSNRRSIQNRVLLNPSASLKALQNKCKKAEMSADAALLWITPIESFFLACKGEQAQHK